MLSGKDKLYHILSCAFITIFTFLALVIVLHFYKKRIGTNGVADSDDDDDDDEQNSNDDDDGNDQDCDVEIAASSSYQKTNNARPDRKKKRIENSSLRCRSCRNDKHSCILAIVVLSGMVSMAIGIAKEIGDAYDIWPPCHAINEDDGSMVGCQSSWDDILADFIGVVLGGILILLAFWLRGLYVIWRIDDD
mmetsp:Transcript_4066/g.8950  ORF Transcript_4066/g.8950 Transcript_4066/m.8950 type:complete len:192 (-) Transcript_4066:891-1466(-)